MTEAVRYLTDDRDQKRRQELVIQPGGNGDWYVATVPEGTGTLGKGVRICTSGGAATAAPGLPAAIADAYRALLAAGEPPKPKQPDLLQAALTDLVECVNESARGNHDDAATDDALRFAQGVLAKLKG